MAETNSHLNIAMLGHKRIPSREGGIEIVVEQLSTRLVKLGHKVTCYNRRGHHVSGAQYDASSETSDPSSTDKYKGVKIKTVWTVEKKGLAAMTSSLSAAWKAAWGAYNVVHIHAEGPAAMCGLVKFIWKIRGKRDSRLLVTVHGLDWARAKWGGFAIKYIKHGEKQAVRHADEIVVLSRGVQEYFRITYNRETKFVPNGVSLPTSQPAKLITEKWGLEKDSYVLFLGRIVPEKGLRYLIEAWRGIKTDKKLVIAGGSSDTADFMEELKTMASGDERVLFTGFQQGRILEELYSNAYIYTLPSDLEGMPLSLLEAMSYGNCCVVSDIDEMTEVVEDKAITFRHSDVEELKNVLQELLDEPRIVNEYKKPVAEFITTKYNWDDVVDRTLELYRR